MKTLSRFVFFMVCGLSLFASARTGSSAALPEDKINVVTSLPDMASIAKEIGGDKVEAFAIAKGYQDPHFVDAKPSYMIKLQKADMFVMVGLDLEIGWVPPLLEGARNPKILPGATGYVDASKGIALLEVPTGDPAKLRTEGDIHVYGNPHYWLDPLRGKVIAENICEGLLRLAPQHEAYFKSNLEAFHREIDMRTAAWIKMLRPYDGAKIAAFHNSWPYFDERFGFNIISFIEPKPGIPPTPKHLVEVINKMTAQNAKVIIIEPYYTKDAANLVASKTGAHVVELATSVESQPGVNSYFEVFDYNVKKLVEAFINAGVTDDATSKSMQRW